MAMKNPQRQTETADLRRAKDMTQFVLRDWDFMGWASLLSDQAVLSLCLGAIDVSQIAGIEIVAGELQVIGAKNAQRVLDSFYDEMRHGLLITTKLISGYHVVLAGDFVVKSTKANTDDDIYPIALYMLFNSSGQIDIMTITQIDLRPLAKDIWAATQGDGTLQLKETQTGSGRVQ